MMTPGKIRDAFSRTGKNLFGMDLVNLILSEKSLEEISEFRKYIKTGSG